MARLIWRRLPLNERIRWLRYVLPPILATMAMLFTMVWRLLFTAS
jgi:hypothetical protein